MNIDQAELLFIYRCWIILGELITLRGRAPISINTPLSFEIPQHQKSSKYLFLKYIEVYNKIQM
jgi:hypothetical protein